MKSIETLIFTLFVAGTMFAGFEPGGGSQDFSLNDPKPEKKTPAINFVFNGNFEKAETKPISWKNLKCGWTGWSSIHSIVNDDTRQKVSLLCERLAVAEAPAVGHHPPMFALDRGYNFLDKWLKH